MIPFCNCKVTFQGHFEEFNKYQICGRNSPQAGESSHYTYLNGYIYCLNRDQQAKDVVPIFQQILKFLHIGPDPNALHRTYW